MEYEGGIVMSIAPEQSQFTLEQLLASDARGRFELIDGQLEQVNVSNLSVDVGAQLLALLVAFCKAHDLGRVFGADSYYQCFPEGERKARKPDVSFIANERLPPDWMEQSFFTIAPDLAVEVLSTNDTAYEIDRKIADYLSVGVRLIWEINPVERTVMIHRLDGTVQKLHDQDQLNGENVIPGFQCKVADFLP
jgi:Uma2 family endonuclease